MDHIQENPDKVIYFSCSLCKKDYDNKRSLARHYKCKSHRIRIENQNYIPISKDVSYYSCECGTNVQRRALNPHLLSNKHKYMMELLELKKINNK